MELNLNIVKDCGSAKNKIINMPELIRLDEIDFETNMQIEDIMERVYLYIKERGNGETYYVNEKSILYDPESHITHEPVWYVDVIDEGTKEKWPDAYTTLAISDRERRLVYVCNDHGGVVEMF